MEKKINNVKIEIVQGDITDQPDIDAVVNAANAQLTTGGGVAGAIHKAAGPKLEKEATKQAPIEPGEAVITDAFELPNDYVIHALGPVYGRDKPSTELLSRCYRNSLGLADEKELTSVAFPSISTGAFGYPQDEAAEVALLAVKEKATELEHVKHVRFVLFSNDDLVTFEEKMENIF